MRVKKTILALFAIAALLFSSFSLFGCEAFGYRKLERTEHRFFDTVCTLVGYEKSEKEFAAVADKVFTMLEEYHKLYDIRNAYKDINNLYEINKVVNGSHRKLTVDERIIDLILFSKEAYALSGGATNVAMGSVLSLWSKAREEYEELGSCNLPSEAALKAAALHTDIEAVEVDRENSTVYISDPGITLDVGATAKGYATEMIARELENMGISGYMLNFGGNVRVVGSKPSGDDWSVGIEDPRADSKDPFLRIIETSSAAVVTSGSYHRYLVYDGKKYHHIIDPDTLYPAQYYISVSVISDNSGMADALSTALFTMPIGEALDLINSIDGAEAMLLDINGELHFSQGFDSLTKK
ncbi:MAG: FAD:protein FMN transferase [Clostridia bacterium]|nr:FAD:protein FMN transferase [Clostridia bacterium]